MHKKHKREHQRFCSSPFVLFVPFVANLLLVFPSENVCTFATFPLGCAHWPRCLFYQLRLLFGLPTIQNAANFWLLLGEVPCRADSYCASVTGFGGPRPA
jgi:hypothetical protein